MVLERFRLGGVGFCVVGGGGRGGGWAPRATAGLETGATFRRLHHHAVMVLERFRLGCLQLRWMSVVSHPLRKERTKDGAPEVVITLNSKMHQVLDNDPQLQRKRRQRAAISKSQRLAGRA